MHLLLNRNYRAITLIVASKSRDSKHSIRSKARKHLAKNLSLGTAVKEVIIYYDRAALQHSPIIKYIPKYQYAYSNLVVIFLYREAPD